MTSLITYISTDIMFIPVNLPSQDLRKQSVASTFHGKAESIRDVQVNVFFHARCFCSKLLVQWIYNLTLAVFLQFSPFDGQKFAAACENGNIQVNIHFTSEKSRLKYNLSLWYQLCKILFFLIWFPSHHIQLISYPV